MNTPSRFPSEEARYKILRILEKNPEVTQRQLATSLGISLGKVNYCVQALVEKGLIKARNFSQNSNKRHYLYVLTPSGFEKKTIMARRFLRQKVAEYEVLKTEIEETQKDLNECSNRSQPVNSFSDRKLAKQ